MRNQVVDAYIKELDDFSSFLSNSETMKSDINYDTVVDSVRKYREILSNFDAYDEDAQKRILNDLSRDIVVYKVISTGVLNF
jgi:hypothetical protein